MEERYVLTVLCDHADTEFVGAPALVVTRLAYFPRPEPTAAATKRVFGWLEWRELEHEDDPTYPPALQTYFGEARRLGRSSLTHGLHELVPGMTYGQRWRFWCRTCETTRPMKHELAEQRLDALRQTDTRFVLLAQFAPLTA